MARLARVLVVFALLAACRSFDFERQQVFLRYSPETDVLDALLVYEGVGSTKGKPEETEKASRVLRAIGAGRRHVLLFDWPFDFDLEEIVKELDAEQELQLRFLTYQPSIEVPEARFLLDERERLCLIQRVRVRDASAGLRLVDALTNRLLLEELSESDRGDGSDLLDDPLTRELMRRRAEDQGVWARFDGTSLVVSVPMTPQAAATQLRQLQTALSEHDAWKDAFLLDSLSGILVDGEGLRLTFAPAADGWIAFTRTEPSYTYRPTVAEELARFGTLEKGDLASEIVRLKTAK